VFAIRLAERRTNGNKSEHQVLQQKQIPILRLEGERGDGLWPAASEG